jgi:HEPN domain-containing protein
MPHDDARVEALEMWLTSAKSNFRMAQAANALVPPEWTQVTYHCQQTVERAIKGLHVVADKDVERVHDLEKLRVGLTGTGIDPGIRQDDAEWLTDLYFTHRYGDVKLDAEPLTAEDVERALVIAREVLAAAAQAASPTGG